MTWRHDPHMAVTVQNDGAQPFTVCLTNSAIADRQVPYDVAYFCIDPCTQILWDSLVTDRNDQTAAAKADRAKRRAARLELLGLEQQARTMRKP